LLIMIMIKTLHELSFYSGSIRSPNGFPTRYWTMPCSHNACERPAWKFGDDGQACHCHCYKITCH